MKKILHIIDTTGPGGAETVFIELLSRLDKQKYEAVVLIRGPGWVCDELRRRGVEPTIIDAKGSFNFRYLFNLIKIIRKEKICLIQAHLLGSGVYSCLAGFLTRVPIVVTLHGIVDVDNERFLSTKFLIINKLASGMVLVSKDLASRLKSLVTINNEKLSIVYNGVELKSYELEKHRKLKDELGLSSDSLIVGSVGNIRPAKAYDILLRAASLLVKKSPNVKFVIVGENENKLYQDMMTLRAELNLEETVFFLGFRQNIPEFLAGIDLFLLSSTSEGCPVSVVEAMASRVPMVVTDCGGLSEMVENNVTAIMCEPGSPAALVEGLSQALGDESSNKKRVSNAKNEASSRFSMEAMLEKYSSIYDNVSTR